MVPHEKSSAASDNDSDSLNIVNKGLVIFFIISIFVTNLLLMCKTVKKDGLKYCPQRMILMSMVTADIYLAVFSLTVKARSIFEGTHIFKSCDLYKPVEIYLNYLVHFVYGTGLILLSLELVLGYKAPYIYCDIRGGRMQAIFYSLLPWTLGLAIVPPLTMHGTTDTSYRHGVQVDCFGNASPERVVAMNLVSVILPATLAVIVSFVVMCDNVCCSVTLASNCNIAGDKVSDHSFNTATTPLTHRQQRTRSDSPARRSSIICILSFVFLLCVVPNAAYNILTAVYSMFEVYGVLHYSFLWMSVFRSFITPLICIICIRN
ncbi:hypothetical protein BsWGS_16409 [Bradybaena similaris]